MFEEIFSSNNVFQDRISDVEVSPDGSFMVSGRFNGSISIGGISLHSSGFDDVFIAKVDPNGSVIWATSAGSPLKEDCDIYIHNSMVCTDSSLPNWGSYSKLHSNKMAVDGDGNTWLTGTFCASNSASYNTDIGSCYATFGNLSIGVDVNWGYGLSFVAKIDSDGNWLWVQKATATHAFYDSDDSYDGIRAHGIAVDPGGGAFVTGMANPFFASCTYGGTLYFGDIQVSGGVKATFLAKISDNGSWEFAITEEGCIGVENLGVDVAVAPSGDVVLLGQLGSVSRQVLDFGGTTVYYPTLNPTADPQPQIYVGLICRPKLCSSLKWYCRCKQIYEG